MGFKKYFIFIVGLILSAHFLIACSESTALAPVVEGWRQADHVEGTHQVKPGETIYEVAWRYDLDFRDLAQYNQLTPPYQLTAGQQLKITPTPGSKPVSRAVVKPITAAPIIAQQEKIPVKVMPAVLKNKPIIQITQKQDKKPVKPLYKAENDLTLQSSAFAVHSVDAMVKSAAPTGWLWPARGKIINNFSAGGMSKGIDIAGVAGTDVKATAQGKVVYCGNGLRGYGELIIIKHNDEFLSAYAHNQNLLVKEGQVVKAGQVIAKMGDSEAQQPMLHFEIRRAGKPVDPLMYLSSR